MDSEIHQAIAIMRSFKCFLHLALIKLCGRNGYLHCLPRRNIRIELWCSHSAFLHCHVELSLLTYTHCRSLGLCILLNCLSCRPICHRLRRIDGRYLQNLLGVMSGRPVPERLWRDKCRLMCHMLLLCWTVPERLQRDIVRGVLCLLTWNILCRRGKLHSSWLLPVSDDYSERCCRAL